MPEGITGKDPSVLNQEEEVLEGASGEVVEESGDFRKEAGDAIDDALGEMEKTHEELQLAELKEWRDGEFKDNMRMIVEAQQDICAQEGNQEACADGARIFQEMFGEPWNQEAEEAPAN